MSWPDPLNPAPPVNEFEKERPSFASYDAHYLESFRVFRERSSESKKLFESFQTHIPPLIQSRMVPECQRLNILSVGSAEGTTDLMILKIIGQEVQKSVHGQHIEVFNRAIEPNGFSCGLYREAIKDLSSLLGNTQTCFEICQQTFDEYQETKKDEIKFDLIHFVHSIYYVDMEETLIRCIEKELSDKGHVLSVIQTTQSLTYLVFSKQQSPTREISDKSEKLIQIAKKHNWNYEVHTSEYAIDFTHIFDPKSTEGNLLLDFMTHTVDYRNTADKQLVQETLAFIDEKTVLKDGKKIGKGEFSLVVISKRCDM